MFGISPRPDNFSASWSKIAIYITVTLLAAQNNLVVQLAVAPIS